MKEEKKTLGGGVTPEHKDGTFDESALKTVTGGTYNTPAPAKIKDALALLDELTKNNNADNMP